MQNAGRKPPLAWAAPARPGQDRRCCGTAAGRGLPDPSTRPSDAALGPV